MSLLDHDDAARSAGQRVASCRDRSLLLQVRAPVTRFDVARSQRALSSARARALAAYVRSGARRRSSGGAGDLLHVTQSLTPLPALMADGSVSLPELMVAYLGLGGSGSWLDVDGYVHGALRLPRIETMLLEQAVSELV